MSTQRLAGAIGQPCRIALPSYPRSGTSWFVDVSEAAVHVTPEPALPGSASRPEENQVFLVVADAPGDYELRFVLKRPWDSEVRNSRRVVLQVRPGARQRVLN